MSDKLLKYLIQEMGTSGPSGLDLDSLLHHAAKFHHDNHHLQDPSSSRPPQRVDDQYLRYLWKVLIEQEGVVVGRVINKEKPCKQQSSMTKGDEPQTVNRDEVISAASSPDKGKGKERELVPSRASVTLSQAAQSQAGDEDALVEEQVELDNEGLPARKKVKGAKPGTKGKQVAKMRGATKGDRFVLLEPDDYLDVRLDDLRDRYEGLRIAVDGHKMFHILTGKHAGHLKISEIIYQALSLIASTKEIGLDSIALGRYLYQDQKMVFYYTKTLLDLGLIAKFQVTAHASFTTNLVHVLYVEQNVEQIALKHAKESGKTYYPDPDRPFFDFQESQWNSSDAIQKRIVDGLNMKSKAVMRTNKIAQDLGFEGPLPQALRRSIQRTIRVMVIKSVIRRVKVRNINKDPNGRKGAKHGAIQLVRPDISDRIEKTTRKKRRRDDEEEEEQEVLEDEEGEEGEGDEEGEEGEAGEASEARNLQKVEEQEDQRMEEAENGEASGPGAVEEELVDRGEILRVPDEEAVPCTSRYIPTAEVSTSMPIERQVVELIKDAGTHGMTFAQIAEKTKITRRFLDTFVDRHCSASTAPAHLSHLNLVAVTDFLGKEKNLVVYTIEAWLEHCKATGIEWDEGKYPPPDPKARGFLSLDIYQLWTEQKTRGEWYDSYAFAKIPGIRPWVTARGGSWKGSGPGARQGIDRTTSTRVPRPSHVSKQAIGGGGKGQLRQRRDSQSQTGEQEANDEAPIDPLKLLNKKMRPLEQIPKDGNGAYIFTRIQKGKGPGAGTIQQLHDIVEQGARIPFTSVQALKKVVMGANYFGFRIPGLVEDTYGEGSGIEVPDPVFKEVSPPLPSKAYKSRKKADALAKQSEVEANGGSTSAKESRHKKASLKRKADEMEEDKEEEPVVVEDAQEPSNIDIMEVDDDAPGPSASASSMKKASPKKKEPAKKEEPALQTSTPATVKNPDEIDEIEEEEEAATPVKMPARKKKKGYASPLVIPADGEEFDELADDDGPAEPMGLDFLAAAATVIAQQGRPASSPRLQILQEMAIEEASRNGVVAREGATRSAEAQSREFSLQEEVKSEVPPEKQAENPSREKNSSANEPRAHLVEVVIEVSQSPLLEEQPEQPEPGPSLQTEASGLDAVEVVPEAGPLSQKGRRVDDEDEAGSQEPEAKPSASKQSRRDSTASIAGGDSASRSGTPGSRKTLVPSTARAVRLKGAIDFARQKRDKYIVQWIESVGGIHDNGFAAPAIHQRWLEGVIAEAKAQKNDLRMKASLQDRRTWDQTLARIEDKGIIKFKTCGVKLRYGDMATHKIFYLAILDNEKVDEWIRAFVKERTVVFDPHPKPDLLKKKEPVVEVDMGFEPHTATTLRRLRTSQIVPNLTLEDVLEVVDDDEAVRKLFLFEWRTASQLYGFICGPFPRALVFHKELLKIVEVATSESNNVVLSKKQRLFNLNEVILDLPLGVFLKLVSVSSPVEDLEPLLATEEGRRTKMRDCTKELQKVLLVDRKVTRQKFQRMIQNFFYFKMALPLHVAAKDSPGADVEAVDADGKTQWFVKDLSVGFTHFQLVPGPAPLYAVGNEVPAIVEIGNIGTVEEVVAFWNRMEDLALNPSEPHPDPLPPQLACWPAWCDYPNQLSLKQERSWMSDYLLSPVQREFLLRAINFSNPAAPVTAPAELQRLAYCTAVPLIIAQEFLVTQLQKTARKKQAFADRAQQQFQMEKARVEKKAKQTVAGKRAELRIQLEEDWNALARKYLHQKGIFITDQLVTDLRGLRENELKETSKGRLDASHIAIVVQAMLELEADERPQPTQPTAVRPAPRAPKEKVTKEKRVETEEEKEARKRKTDAKRDAKKKEEALQRRLRRGRAASAIDGGSALGEGAGDAEGGGEDAADVAREPKPTLSFLPVTEDDDDLIPDLGQHELDPAPEEGRRRARLHYTEELDDLITDMGCILTARSTRPGCRMYWRSVSKITPGFLPGSIRVRFLKLKDDPTHSAYMNRLQDAYIELWKAHRKTDALPDPPRHKAEDFDFRHHLKFFRKNVNKDELRANSFGAAAAAGQKEAEARGRIGVAVPPLPSAVEELASWALQDKRPKNFETTDDWLWLHDRKKAASEEQNEKRMSEIPFVMERSEPEKSDPPPPAEWLAADPEMSVLAASLKMTLAVPENIYDAETAHNILVRQPRDYNVLQRVTRAMINGSIITKRDFHVMSRSYHLNQTHSKLDGPLSSKFFSETAKVEDHGGEESILLEEESSRWPFTASEGSTAALLNLVSENRVELDVDREDINALTGKGLWNTKKLEDNDIEMHVYGRIVRPADDQPDWDASNPGELELKPAEYLDEERDEALEELKLSDSIDVAEGAELLQEYLLRAGNAGLSWDQLFNLPAFDPPLTATRIITFARAFTSSYPPLAFWAGYDYARLISSKYIRTWCVVIAPRNADEPRALDPEGLPRAFGGYKHDNHADCKEDVEEDGGGDKDGSVPPARAVESLKEGEGKLVLPRRWLNLGGELIPGHWEKAVRCVLGSIMARPTSEALIRAALSTTFDRPELTDIFRFLLDEGIITRSLVDASFVEGEGEVDKVFKHGEDVGEVGWASKEQEKRVFFNLVEGRWLEGF